MNTQLVLFLSRATPLARWAKQGIFSREVAIYNQLRPWLGGLSIVTSGDKEELNYQDRLSNINLLYNRWDLSPNFYSVFASILHHQTLRQATMYKTNQLDGAWSALIAGWLYNKPVLVRAGYPWARNFRNQYGESVKARIIGLIEKFILRQATHIVVTTEAIKKLFVNKYGTSSTKITVIPNYVDTEAFYPKPDINKIEGRICFVGRLQSIKNVDLVIEALVGIPNASLVVIGDGPERERLEKLAQQYQVNVQFKGVIPNTDIPIEINRSEAFILPSQFEGHPKALIEAMACGVPVLGTDVPGINNVIRSGETGLLCEPTVEGIRSAVQSLLSNSALRTRLGIGALAFARREYSLERIVQMELKLYQRILQ